MYAAGRGNMRIGKGMPEVVYSRLIEGIEDSKQGRALNHRIRWTPLIESNHRINSDLEEHYFNFTGGGEDFPLIKSYFYFSII